MRTSDSAALTNTLSTHSHTHTHSLSTLSFLSRISPPYYLIQLEAICGGMAPKCAVCGGDFFGKNANVEMVARGLMKYHEDCLAAGTPCHTSQVNPEQAVRVLPDTLILCFEVKRGRTNEYCTHTHTRISYTLNHDTFTHTHTDT